ncbi:DNA gyrase inhibitor [compost metagenome]
MDDSIYKGELAGGKYAVFKVKHTAEDIKKAWNEIFPALHHGGYQMDNKPIFERYIGDMLYNEDCDICIPIKPL